MEKSTGDGGVGDACPPVVPLFETRRILDVNVVVARRSDVIAFLLKRLASHQKTMVAFANTNLLTHAAKNAGLRRALEGMVVLNDGVALDLASKFLFGSSFAENLNGTDFTPELLKSVPKGTRVFLYGARPEVVARLAKQLASEHQLEICGWQDGYTPRADLIGVINASRADIVLVALGNPLQETWIDKYRDSLSAPLLLGVGAYFDFASRDVPRAPDFMRKMRCEWLFRLALEPKRLWRRYSVEAVWFFYLIFRQAGIAKRGM